MRHSLIGPMSAPNLYFDSSVAGNNPYHPYAMEAGRRKNATREVTQPLKDWLKQHSKNPYPTKAEKTVLAIVTGMTMTQVKKFKNKKKLFFFLLVILIFTVSTNILLLLLLLVLLLLFCYFFY